MPVNRKHWYTIDDISKIDSPALVIYLDRVKHNISLAIAMVGDVSRLRPHVKTHKSPQATALMLQAGITKFKCATIAEAEMLSRRGAPDVLLAYQPVGPKINRLIAMIQQFPDTSFSCLVDSASAAQAIAAEATARQVTANLFLDINVGMNRTGVAPPTAVDLYKECRDLSGLKVVGLHGYDGHITDTDVSVRKSRADDAYQRLLSIQEELIVAGLQQPVMVLGGSPTFPMHAARSGVECSPGTFVYWDWSYSDSFPDMDFLPAALVVSRVVSVLNEGTFCLDLGHKSIAAENPLSRRVQFLDAPDLVPVGHSEEHLVVESSSAHRYHVGEILYGMPFHVCPTCALYDTAFVIEDGRVKESWETVARDRRLSI